MLGLCYTCSIAASKPITLQRLANSILVFKELN